MALFTRKGCSFVPDGKAKDSCDMHDFDYKLCWYQRLDADKKFRANMIADGCPWIQHFTYYWGVRIFGRLFL